MAEMAITKGRSSPPGRRCGNSHAPIGSEMPKLRHLVALGPQAPMYGDWYARQYVRGGGMTSTVITGARMGHPRRSGTRRSCRCGRRRPSTPRG